MIPTGNMTVRAFALAVIGLAFALLAGTMALNVGIDPEAVFRQNHSTPRVNGNSRYQRYLEYRDAREHPDGVIFASSRGNGFDRKELADALGVPSVANFSFTYGMISDHLPTLEYLLRDKAARGETLKAVWLMLDVDHFGKPPWTNINLDGFLPPEVSGESPARFWWRYLTAFQFRVWSATLRGVEGRRVEALPPPAHAALLPPLALPDITMLRRTALPQRQYDIVQRPYIEAHLAMLARFVALCRQHGVRLTVVTSPLNRANARDYDPAELARVAGRIGRVTPVWDFGTPDWLSDRADLWMDPSHFREPVARMMLDRVLGRPGARPDFGTLRGG
jgi:hypothetical protein